MKKKIIIFLSVALIFITSVAVIKRVNKPEQTTLEDISYNTFKNKIKQEDNFVLFIRKDGCAPCKIITPYVNQLNEYESYDVCSINLNKIDNADVFQNEYNINGTPTIILFNRGQEKKRIFGLVDKDTFFNEFGVKNYE